MDCFALDQEHIHDQLKVIASEVKHEKRLEEPVFWICILERERGRREKISTRRKVLHLQISIWRKQPGARQQKPWIHHENDNDRHPHTMISTMPPSWATVPIEIRVAVGGGKPSKRENEEQMTRWITLKNLVSEDIGTQYSDRK
ncbi:hypothetical protein JHK85_040761 [Glycine max]|nr:hypothetical protein JHK85_040761 [Glycine max]